MSASPEWAGEDVGGLALKPSLTVLHVGCSNKQTVEAMGLNLVRANGERYDGAIDLINLDMRASVEPDIVCELGVEPIPLPENHVDAVLALHILEHIGRQGELDAWFYAWQELYRVLKPGGIVQFECPYHASVWAWADPTHTRAISEYTFLYFNHDAYRERARGSAIPDYRPPFDFQLAQWRLKADGSNADVRALEGDRTFIVGTLVARKPFRPYWED